MLNAIIIIGAMFALEIIGNVFSHSMTNRIMRNRGWQELPNNARTRYLGI